MDTAPSPIRSVSDTALWTAAYRADESDRPDSIFRDPYARRLAGERGFEIVRAMKRPAVRYGVVLRTAAIDLVALAGIRERGCDTVLNLAAGLDTRAWRFDLPPALRWIDVDLPDLLEYKDAVLKGEEPGCVHEEVRLDLADREARVRLFDRVGAESLRVLVLTEGLLSYLEPEMVAALADDLHAQPSFAEWVTELAGGHIPDRIKNARADIRPEDARTRFAPAENTAFFVPHGWAEAEYVDLFLESARLGRDSLLGMTLRGVMPVLPRTLRARLERGLGVARLERIPVET
jgi:methyltransferase (TIGR00027 family)